ANSPWRTMSPLGPRRSDDFLQCGHGEFAVENPNNPSVIQGTIALQCGHGEFAVENCSSGDQAVVIIRPFNAATANSPWSTTRVIMLPRDGTTLQCGHGEFAVENYA